MFNNKFNSSKSDPLVEAVKQAQHDGDLRRQAEAYVNEEFGVYSRQAVVREHLAAYDTALAEAYKSLKEGKPNDGNLANNYPPYDKVTRGDVIAGRLGKDQMGGKKKMEEKKDCYEESDGLPPSAAAKEAGAKQEKETPSSTPPKTGNAAGSTISNARAATGLKEAIARKRDIAKGGVTAPIEYADKMGFANPGAISKLDEAWSKLKEARKCMEEESDTFDFSHLDEAYANYIAEAINEYGLQEEHPVVTVENLHMFNESYVAAVLDEAAEREYEKAKEHEEKTKELDEARMRAEKECNEEELEEAKKWIQSAIKRPGSLSKKLGVPEEKNIPASKLEVKKGDTAQTKKQKVLAKTLKHLARKKKMDEEAQIDEVSAFGQAFRAAGGKNFSFGGKTYSGARADGKTSTPAAKSQSVTTLAPTAPGAQAKIQSTTTQKGLSDPGRWENEAKAKTGSMQQIRGGKVLPPSSQLGTNPNEKSTQSFLNKELGKTTQNAQGPEAPSTSKPVPTPPSRPTFSSDLPKIDTGPKLNPQGPGLANQPSSAPKADVPTPPSRPPMASDLPKIDTGPSANPQGPGTSGADGADGASIAGGKGGKGGKGGSSINESVQIGDRTYRIV